MRLMRDVYFGDGPKNPPIVTRLDRIEQVIEAVERLKWYMVAAIITSLIAAASTHIHF